MLIEAFETISNFSKFMTAITIIFCHGEPTFTSIPVPSVTSNLTGVDVSVGNIRSPNPTTIKTMNSIIPIPSNFLFTNYLRLVIVAITTAPITRINNPIPIMISSSSENSPIFNSDESLNLQSPDSILS